MVTLIRAAAEHPSLAAPGESGVCLAQAVRVQQSHTNVCWLRLLQTHQPEGRRVSASAFQVQGALL